MPGCAVIARRCCLPFVPRASRVAAAFAFAMVFVSTVACFGSFGSATPKLGSIPSFVGPRASFNAITSAS